MEMGELGEDVGWKPMVSAVNGEGHQGQNFLSKKEYVARIAVRTPDVMIVGNREALKSGRVEVEGVVVGGVGRDLVWASFVVVET